MSSSVTWSISSIGALDSTTTMAVMSLVSEAIGSTAWEFLLNSTSEVSWSTTSATLDFRSSGSRVACSPPAWPKDNRRGSVTGTGRTARLATLRTLPAWAFPFAACGAASTAPDTSIKTPSTKDAHFDEVRARLSFI